MLRPPPVSDAFDTPWRCRRVCAESYHATGAAFDRLSQPVTNSVRRRGGQDAGDRRLRGLGLAGLRDPLRRRPDGQQPVPHLAGGHHPRRAGR